MKKTSINTLRALKRKNEKFSCLTAYDACFSHYISEAGIDVMLVGDSLGMVLQGLDSTVPVTMDSMVYHTQCVKRGANGPMIMSDLPFMSFSTPELAMANATRLMQAGAEMVKLEGGHWTSPIVSQLVERGIPVCVHLGLTPQSVHKLGGYKVQGKDNLAAEQMQNEAKEAETAGADILLLECVPAILATKITEQLSIPVIGIGAGSGTDGQVLVLHDMLGLNPGKMAKFVKNFMIDNKDIPAALSAYHNAVKSVQFPQQEHFF